MFPMTSPNLHNLIQMTAGITVGLAVRYTILAGFAWMLGYVFFRSRWTHRKIIARLPVSSEVWREIRYSGVSVVVFGAVGAITVWAAKQGWTQMYWKIGKYGWGWFWLSILLAILLHDTYFYWTHRLMHHRRLFRLFHRTHHLSHNPTPWASYAFSPMEAFVQAVIFPLTVFIMPIQPVAFVVFMAWQLIFNIAGHTGYEYNPRRFMKSWVRYFINTPTNHIMHHEKLRGNYGLYFNFWDRLMRTNHDDYEARFCEITSQRRAVQPSPPPASAVLAE